MQGVHGSTQLPIVGSRSTQYEYIIQPTYNVLDVSRCLLQLWPMESRKKSLGGEPLNGGSCRVDLHVRACVCSGSSGCVYRHLEFSEFHWPSLCTSAHLRVRL